MGSNGATQPRRDSPAADRDVVVRAISESPVVRDAVRHTAVAPRWEPGGDGAGPPRHRRLSAAGDGGFGRSVEARPACAGRKNPPYRSRGRLDRPVSSSPPHPAGFHGTPAGFHGTPAGFCDTSGDFPRPPGHFCRTTGDFCQPPAEFSHNTPAFLPPTRGSLRP